MLTHVAFLFWARQRSTKICSGTGYALQLRLAPKAGQAGVYAAIPRRLQQFYYYVTFTIIYLTTWFMDKKLTKRFGL
jgi:hypothetical protein